MRREVRKGKRRGHGRREEERGNGREGDSGRE